MEELKGMEQEEVPTMTPQPQIPKSQPVVIRKNNNVPLIGAIIFLAIVIGIAAIYLGTQKKNETTLPIVVQPPTATPTTTSEILVTIAQTQPKISYTSTKLPNTSFDPYTISYPADWTKDAKKDTVTDTLTLTKDGYIIKIYQAPTEGNICIFEDPLPTDIPFVQDFRGKQFTDIFLIAGTLRRVEIASQKPTQKAYTFCMTTPSKKGSYGTPTSFGFITYSVPQTPDESMLSEMDSIIKTLK